jgi:hypothetical protein
MSKSKRLSVESTADFKARLAAMMKAKGEPARPRPPIVKRKGCAPTPSEVLGGKKMPKMKVSTKTWLKSIGVKV